jgi:hypothetical protein
VVVLELAVVVLLITVVYLAVKARQRPTPLETLQRELAEGRITEEEFWERESALRASMPRKRR